MSTVADRAAVSQRLIQLHEAHGSLTPDLVVEDAKRPDSPLHACFEWDIDKAATAHWLETARTLIRSVRVEVVNQQTTLTAPYFVRDPRAPARDQGYIAIGQIKDDRELAREVVIEECARAQAAFRRAKEVAQAVGEQSAVERLLTQTQKVIERASKKSVAKPKG
jgi:hypothetical protein